ncbi:protease inhibitor I42 family protein, partial [Bacillus thuringiensis]|nr:protease inhibitor I42 family protein [Bacillus thuringiensis]
MSHRQPLLILTQKDHGKTIPLHIGQVFSIQLIENPTTGYRWTVCTIPEVHLLTEKFQSYSISEEAIGHTGIRLFQFQVIHAGIHELQLKHWREWQG